MTQIRVWCVFYDDIEDEQLLHGYSKLLNEQERIRQQRFALPDDRKRYLVTRALLRTTLSRHFVNVIAPEQWIFVSGHHGRPEIAPAHVQAKGISFSISHTKGLIIVGIVSDRMLGVDTEEMNDRHALADLASGLFAPAEVQALAELPPKQRQQRFLELWALKESYVKARGIGLSVPLDQMVFRLSQDQLIEVFLDTRQFDVANRWRFWQFSFREHYVVAVCAERKGSDCPNLLLYETVPMVSETILLCPTPRTSG